MTAEKKVFVRKATGLVREIGFVTAVLVVICNVVGLGWQKRAFQFSGPAPVPETTYVMGLAPITMSFILVGIVVLFTVFVFAILGAAMPRSGGGYIWISRLIHPFVGFVASWLEYFSIAVSYGLIGTAVWEAILIYGGIGGVAPEIMATLSQSSFLFLGGVFFVCIFGIVAMLGVSMAGRLLSIMFWIPLAITVLLYGALLAASPAVVNAGIQAITGHDAVYYTKMALDQGMATAFKGNYWDAMNISVLGSYWAYIGFAASTFVAGEIKEASKTLPRTLFLANGFIIILYITMSYLAVRACMMVGGVGDWTFFNAYSFLSYGGGAKRPPELPKAWMPVVAAFSAKGLGWDWLLALIPIFAAFWVANDIPPFVLTSSRIIFAMSFDRVVPERLAAVNERFHSPINAVLLTMLVAFIGNAGESDILSFLGPENLLFQYINSSTGVQATDLWDTIFFLLSSIAGLAFVLRKKGRDIFARSAYKPNLTLVTIVAVIAVAGNIWLGYAEFPAIVASYGWNAWYFTVFLLVVGALIYIVYKYGVGQRTGADYTTIYAEVPPE